MNILIKRDQIDFMTWQWEALPLSPRDKAMYEMGLQAGNIKIDTDQLEKDLQEYVQQNKRGLTT